LGAARVITLLSIGVTFAFVPACGETKPGAGAAATAGASAAAGATATAGAPSTGGAGHGGAASRGSIGTDDDFLEAMGQGYCARLFRCNESSDDFMTARLVLKTPAACEAKLRALADEGGRLDLRQQVAAGNMQLDPAAAAKCVAELSECNGPDSFNEGSCREVYEGKVPTGGDCRRDEDCSGDAYCESKGGCPGQCRPRKAAGEPCERSSDCAYTPGSAVFCDQNAATPVCRVLAEAPHAGQGDPCTRRLHGSDSWIRCRDELWCAADPSLAEDAAQGRCQAPIAPGKSCADGDDVCVEGICDTASNVCVQPTLVAQAGEACDETKLQICDPTLGLFCNDSGTCDGSGDGSEGSSCFTGDFQRGCAKGLHCAPTGESRQGTCTKLLAAGAPCESAAECASHTCENTCQERYCAL